MSNILKGLTDGRYYNPSDWERREQAAMDQEKRDFKRRELDWELRNEPKNNYAVHIDGRLWKVFADERQAQNIARSLQRKGKDAKVYITGASPTAESIEEGVIYQLDKEDPLNKSEILVLGGAGRYTFDKLREKARREAEQLSKDLQVDHPNAFTKSAYNVKQLDNTLKTIAAAYEEMETIRKQGGVRSRNIKGAVEEGLDRPKVLFNPKPMRKGPGDSPDDYEYTDYVPRGKEDKEAWAIKRTVAKQKLQPKKQKELDTGFYKNYLSNRPVREDDVEENVKDAIKNVRKKFRQSAVGRAREHGYRIEESQLEECGVGYELNSRVANEEQAPMFTPEENLSELKQDTIDDYISRKSALARGGLPEPAKKFGNVKAPAWKIAAAKIAKPGSEMEKYAKVKATLEDEAKMINANDPRSDGWRVYKDKPAGAKESAVMKGIQGESSKGK